jgi:hypothetical protein
MVMRILALFSLALAGEGGQLSWRTITGISPFLLEVRVFGFANESSGQQGGARLLVSRWRQLLLGNDGAPSASHCQRGSSEVIHRIGRGTQGLLRLSVGGLW